MNIRRRPVTGALLAAATLLTLMAGSCGASADLAIRADRSALVSVRAEIPAAVESRIRQFIASGTAGGAASGAASAQPLFNANAVSASMRDRGVSVVESAASGSRSYRGVFRVADLDGLSARDPELAGVLEYRHGPGWASLQMRLRRGNAAALAHLFPGIDQDLLEALQPPALYDNPVSVTEYRSMLAGLLGTTAVQAIDGMTIALAIRTPGPIIESNGVTRQASDRSAADFSVRAIDALVLEAPVEFFVRWQEP